MITTLFQYSRGISIPLFILWCIYRVSLSSEKRFKTNRIILLCSYFVSLLMFPVLMLLPYATSRPVYGTVIIFSKNSALIPDIITTLSYIWIVGVAVISIATIIEMAHIYYVVKKSKKVEFEGKIIHVSDNMKLSPFSFWNLIIMNRHDFTNNPDLIISHESGHQIYHHTWDIMMAQIVAVICWYNPAAWLLKSELKTLHEYQADAFTLARGYDAQKYQLFIIEKAVGSKLPTITNNLSHTKLRKRISMMNRPEKTSVSHLLRYLLPVAGIIIGIIALNTHVVKATLTPIKRIVSENSSINSKSRLEYDVYMDGKEIPNDRLNEINPNTIKSITVHKNDNRTQLEIYTNQSEQE